MEAACRLAEVQIGTAVSARVADSAFGQAVDRIGTERLATAEVMMIDLLLQRLAETRDDRDRDKAVLALWQALREDRRRPAARPASGGSQKQAAQKDAAGNPAARLPEGPIGTAADRATELAQLIAAVEARLAAAEADKS